jgi:dihydroxyacetone kinase-like protein
VALGDLETAAREGWQSTKDLVAKTGRARRLGERTIGHLDPGATSCYFVLRAYAGAVHAG